MTPHSLPRRLAGAAFVLWFVNGLYQYLYGVLLPGLVR